MARFKKRAETALVGLPDLSATIGPLLQPDEHIVGWAWATLLAFVSVGSRWRLGAVGVKLGLARQDVSQHRYLAGVEGSAAMSIPRDLDGSITMAITDQRVTLWSFASVGSIRVTGSPGRDRPPALVASFPRSDVRWIARTGRADRYGTHMRCSFADESFIDVAVMEHAAHAPFFVAAADIGR